MNEEQGLVNSESESLDPPVSSKLAERQPTEPGAKSRALTIALTYLGFPKTRVPFLGVLVIRALLFWSAY